jgi:adenine-specific DNA-methyltransferase
MSYFGDGRFLQFISNSFSGDSFLNFCYDFLTDRFEPARVDVDISNFNGDIIQQATFIGEDVSLEISVFVIRHNSNKDPRVTLTKEIQRVMKLYKLPNALVALYSDDSKQWRLSLVTTQITDDLKNKFSNPKRASFVLGEGAKIKTAKKQLEKK